MTEVVLPSYVNRCICALVPVIAMLACRLVFSARKHRPPGPQPAPIIGNIHQLPTASAEEKFAEWHDTYGDVIYLEILGRPIVILNGLEAAQDLLDKRSSIYSDRPRFVLMAELMGWHNASTHVRYGPRFRKHRRFIHQTFNQQAVHALKPVQEKETMSMIQGMIRQPELFDQHIQRFAAATIMKITYGTDVTSVDDPFVLLAQRAGKLTVQSGTPAGQLVDFIPLMKYIPTWAPLSGFKRKAAVVKEAVDIMMDVPYETVKEKMLSGTAVPCLTTRLLETCSRSEVLSVTPDDEEDIKGVAGTMYAAAEDTTVCVLNSFVLAMVIHPEVFEKAQKEMDSVIGLDRLPTLEDKPSLPYLQCIFNEVVRWNPPVPLGLPHRLMEDDIYRGYHLPKGTTVLANIYFMLHNCAEPKVFRPERYMQCADLVDPEDVIFGFGRRRCPGRHFATQGIWLAIANMVATLQISRSKDEKGQEIVPDADFSSGFVRQTPKTFYMLYNASDD